MPEILFADHEKLMGQSIEGVNIVFIHGEPYLMDIAKKSLLSKLIPDMSDMEFYLEIYESDKKNIEDIMEPLFSSSFFSDKKIVVYKEPRLFGKASGKEQEAEALISIMEKTLPDSNCLVFLSSTIDKRSKVYKSLKDRALLINCSVPAGPSRKARMEREQIAKTLIFKDAEKYGISVRPDAISRLIEYSDDNFELLMKNFEQVSIYSSDKKVVTAKSVEDVLENSSEDPIYNFTGAVSERNINKSFLIMQSLLDSGFHPLQLISALVSQVRKMILVHEFMDSRYGKSWYPGITYDSFSSVVNDIKTFDEALLANLEFMNINFSGGDYLVYGTKRSTYPLFLLLKNASKFYKEKLSSFIVDASEIDYRIKNGADPVQCLEKLILELLL